MFDNLIKYGIAFGPTILFALIVLIRALIGYYSGARRQVIFVIHSVIAFTICLIIYFILVENKSFDVILVKIINKFMGENGLQEALGVTSDNMKGILVEYFISNMSFSEGLQMVLTDNGAYLLALVNVSYHIILALILYYVYLLLEGLMFILYLIFYSERKHIRKKNEKYENNSEDRPYIKYKKYGATIGLFRGIIRGLICLSFLGAILYVTSGVGNKNRTKYKTNNEYYDLGFTIYKEIGNYGEHGIYKVLNMCKDKNDVPYYLYAADLVLQGGLKDVSRGINTNIYLREELNAYVEFSTDTFDLLMKYGSDELIPIILGKSNENAMDVILKVMANNDFQTDFKLLISEFDAKTYFINFALSLIDSISDHLEDVEFMQGLSPDALEVMNIAFKKGYLSPVIPYEHQLISRGTNAELGYIKPSSLLNANDARIVLNVILDIISLNEKYGKDSNYALKMVKSITKNIDDLSILDTNRSEELNPVLKRLYAYVDAKYLDPTEQTDINNVNYLRRQERINNIIYISEDYDSIDWVKELNLLADSVEDVLVLYENVYIGNRNALEAILAIFDESSTYYKRNIKLYHELVDKLSYSKILGEAVSSRLVTTTLETSIRESLMEDFNLPTNINYSNYEVDGETYYGELYYFLTGIEKLATNKDFNLFDELSNEEEMTVDDTFDLMIRMSEMLAKEEGGETFGAKVLKSKLILSIFSSYIIDNQNTSDDFVIYIDGSLISDNLIDYDELVKFFNSSPKVLNLVKEKGLIDSEEIIMDDIVDLLESDEAKDALDSKIYEGTFSNLLNNNATGNDSLVLPLSFRNGKKWISTNSEESEIKRLIKALNGTKEHFDLLALIDSDSTEDAKDSMKNIDDNDVNLLLDSLILYYSLSKYLVENGETLITDMPIIIPNVVIINDLSGGAYRIEKNTLKVFLSNVKLFITEDDAELNVIRLLKNMLENSIVLDNTIYSATIAYSICNSDGLIHKELGDNLKVPTSMNSYGTISSLINNFTQSNPWKKETKNLVLGMESFIKISEIDDNADFNTELENRIKDEIPNLNNNIPGTNLTKLEDIYKSYIISYTLTDKVQESFDSIIDNEYKYVLDLNKDSKGIYKIENIEGIIYLVNEYNLDIDTIDDSCVDIIKDDLFTDEFKNNNRLNNMYKSFIIRHLITKELDNALVGKVIVDEDKALVSDTYSFYLENEVSSLIELLKCLEITDIDNIDENEISETVKNEFKLEDSAKLSNEKLGGLYSDNITGIILTNQIEEDVEIPYVVLDYVKGKRRKLNLDEVINMRKALARSGVDLDNEETNDLLINLRSMNDSIIPVINESYIIRALITKEIYDNSYNVNKENFLVHNDLAYESRDVRVYKKEEISSFISLIKKTESEEILDELDNLTLYDIVDLIKDSIILTATLTQNLLDSNVVITMSDFDMTNRIMKQDSLELFVRGLMRLVDSETKIEEIKIDQIGLPTSDSDIDYVYSSRSLMATITNSIKIQIDGEAVGITILNQEIYCTIEKGIIQIEDRINYSGRDFAVISRSEFKNINIFLSNHGFDNITEANLDYESLLEEYCDETVDVDSYPNMIYCMLSSHAINTGLVDETYTINVEVISVSDCTVHNISYVPEDVMKEIY